MNPKKVHNVLGLILLLPLLGWICTGVVFLIKPGYAGAYEQISPKLYEIEAGEIISPQKSWKEIRFFRTILGKHLLVKVDGEWQQLDSESLELKPRPGKEQEVLLLSDAISHHYERYGSIEKEQGDIYITSTGVELSLNWNTLSISQKGKDTKLIGTLYQIHYLQWFGNKQANTVLGITGLLALSLLVYYGVVSYLRRRKGLT
ncbi:PepSY domain-containing protein [Psychromonas sp.]|uniref:PepSY domain-containing protein n=1 Tax=Psychromonas sp. TaxID=1884585 RepID=UPI0035628E97